MPKLIGQHSAEEVIYWLKTNVGSEYKQSNVWKNLGKNRRWRCGKGWRVKFTSHFIDNSIRNSIEINIINKHHNVAFMLMFRRS